MSYNLRLSNQAIEDLRYFKRSGQLAIVKKIGVLLHELEEHPYTGIGKPEQLRFELSGHWSRRITQEHRMTYRVEETEVLVEVLTMRGHYTR